MKVVGELVVEDAGADQQQVGADIVFAYSVSLLDEGVPGASLHLGIVEPGRQHVLPPFLHRPGHRGPALVPVQSQAAHSADTNTTTAAACSP